ncbi:MAG: response regulator [Acidimicrobiia bacterium]|nr:response regulator [Acidimicrobiia bacterium]
MMCRELRAERTRILLVEDNPIDARVALQALDGLTRPHEVEHVTDGSEALPALDRATAAGTTHDLILLDLNASGVRGLDILQAITTSSEYRHIPVVILTTSDHQPDIDAAAQHDARAYFVKPRSRDDWTEILDALDAIVADSTPPSPRADL